MLLKALLTADFESAFVLTESAAFLNSDTHESLQHDTNKTTIFSVMKVRDASISISCKLHRMSGRPALRHSMCLQSRDLPHKLCYRGQVASF